jgi:hypothetical protein
MTPYRCYFIQSLTTVLSSEYNFHSNFTDEEIEEHRGQECLTSQCQNQGLEKACPVPKA